MGTRKRSVKWRDFQCFFNDQIVTTQFIKGTDQIVTLPLSDVLHALETSLLWCCWT